MPRRPFASRLPRARVFGLFSLMAALQSACTAATDELTAANVPDAGATARTVQVALPTEGTHLAGTTVFQARLEDTSLPAYSMTWRVDNGAESPMADGPGYKQANVDVSGWSWNGDGPYTVAFRARDGATTVAETSTRIYIDRGATGGPSEETTDEGTSEPTTPPTTGGPTEPPATATDNPISGAVLYADPTSSAKKQADAWRSSRPQDAAAMDLIAQQAQADWFGEWSGDVRAAVNRRASTILATGATPVFVAYNIPVRDCNSYSAGGASSAAAYRSWIRSFADGIGGRQVIVILEPDALAGMDCLDAAKRNERVALLADAVSVLEAKGALVYLDGGHARWKSAATMAERLRAAGVESAHGFALNVSNYVSDSDNASYGTQLSNLLGGAHFVIDTSRSGLGPDPAGEWCNPKGRALGHPPTTATGKDKLDAYFWIKRPGESDGTCNGGPSAGKWWAEYALGLAQRTPWVASR